MIKRVPADSPTLFALPDGPDFAFEDMARREGFSQVAGADEAGRGPLAGPVVAAAVIFHDKRAAPRGLNDSKQLSMAQREYLFDEIMATASVAIASSSAPTIDRTDIRKASLDAMRRALLLLTVQPDYALIDGRDVPAGLHCPGKAIVKGDARSISIAAASIIAKVTRDRMMTRAGLVYPAYGFERHAGYATAEHRAAITMVGGCMLHRWSFRPLRRDDSAVENSGSE
ncbi:ribonuclease HII [Rhizobium sp. C4]|uniref:ribonuclease HII n=1 Tax=Rhizobium sp. C4 TaxID=1349800 RepID=UPI001E3C2006|nr:ribonuclease HII [Rhizobium sp. C4]MCD2172908.1 ribonuclease HII [Rhizobium sp. C4]